MDSAGWPEQDEDKKHISALGWKHADALPPALASPLDMKSQHNSRLVWNSGVPLGSLRFVCLSEVLEAETDFQGSDTDFWEVYFKFVGAIFSTVLIIQRTSLTFDRWCTGQFYTTKNCPKCHNFHAFTYPPGHSCWQASQLTTIWD